VSSENHALLVAVGKRIRSLREEKGLTQTDLAVHLDMNRGHISDIELGKREAGLITLQIIAKGLETTMSRLLKKPLETRENAAQPRYV
jgi:transcriptional regulator with XRE-family HTH domain